MELINNTTKTLKDDLSVEIKQGSKLSIAAACFSIYAFQELKEQLSQIEQLRFIFTSPTFVTEKAKKERREFYIPRLTRERSLYGTEFEIKLRNELTQKAIARECAEWIRQKVTFKSNVSDKSIQGQIVVDSVGYTPINNFTTVELGCEKGNVISTTIVKDESLARTLLADFNEIWNDSKVLQVVTDEVIDSITAAYNENSPDFIYFVTLYNIFNEFLEDVSEDVLPNEATGFKESKIWGMLYNFQKDAALAIINKLEKYNGCILADSVGLGKTFTALAVIKYYENRNKSVLVLCPKKLTNNWNTYKDNYVNNPIAADRLRYDVLYHTDLNRTHGTSNGLDLDRLNWGNYDLVVIDESHNFRNGGKLVENPDEDAKDISRITIVNEITPAKINIPAGEEVGSFFVLLVALKTKDFDEKTVATLSKLIPQNILFVLEFEGQSKLAIYHTKLMQTDWKPTESCTIELRGLNLDKVWENIVVDIGGVSIADGNTLDEQIAADKCRQKIEKEIAKLEKQARAEKQPKKKFEFVQQIMKLKKQLRAGREELK